MSMYADYIKERLGDEIIENECGFATFRYVNGGHSVYIVDIYVSQNVRCNKIASAMADEIKQIAKKQGCTEMLGSVAPKAKNATTSIKVLLAYGFELQSSSQELIVFRKGI